MQKNRSVLIAKLLILTSFILFVLSAVVYSFENKEVAQPKDDVEKQSSEQVNITVKGNNLEEDNTSDVQVEDNSSNDNDIQEEVIPNVEESTPIPDVVPNENYVPEVSERISISEEIANARQSIENFYGIKIFYGNETAGYRVGGLDTYCETDEYTIKAALDSLVSAIEMYPYGFFQEIKNGGIPLNLYLIRNYSASGVTGATNAFNNRADISISLQYNFKDSFNHEVFHYIEKYIKKNGDNFNSWDTLNPYNFKYNAINGSLSYNRTFSSDAPFVNNYAQTSAEEDRASTFEYMMADNKASCLNKDKTVWRKALLLAQKLDLTFNTVSPNITEYWERFIY